MTTESLPIPNPNDLKKGIDELLLIEKWDEYKIKSSPRKFEKRFKKLFADKLGIFPHIFMLVSNNSFPFKIYRLRKRINSMNPDLISEHSYPPNRVIKFAQRANLPYHPVFYGADNPMSAIFETIRTKKEFKADNEYYLSEWHIKENIQLKVSPFLFGNVNKSSPYKSFSDESFRKIDEMLSEYSNEQIDSFKSIMSLLSKLFIFDNTYAVSSFIAHSYLYANHSMRTDIFIYPSNQADFKTVNFAIHPNIVIEKLILNKVYRLRVTKLNKSKGLCEVKVNQVGINKESILYWKWIDDIIKSDKKLLNEIEKTFKPHEQ